MLITRARTTHVSPTYVLLIILMLCALEMGTVIALLPSDEGNGLAREIALSVDNAEDGQSTERTGRGDEVGQGSRAAVSCDRRDSKLPPNDLGVLA